MKRFVKILFLIALVPLSVLGQQRDSLRPKIDLELSASINTHYRFEDIQIGYGFGVGFVKEKSLRTRRYIGLEITKNFNPTDSYISDHNKANSSSTTVNVDQLYLIDALIPLFYEFSFMKKKNRLFFDFGGFLSIPIGGRVKGNSISSSYPDPSTVTLVDENYLERMNIGGIAGLGMKFSNGNRDFLTCRLDTRIDLLSETIGHSMPIRNRYVKVTVGYLFSKL